jgi:hypothetical protein
VATSAQILPSLGRNLAAGVNATVTNELIPPNTIFDDRIQQVDVRFTRIFQFGTKAKGRGNFDIYNLVNASAVLAQNTRYGPQWQYARQILGGRLFKFSGQLDF